MRDTFNAEDAEGAELTQRKRDVAVGAGEAALP
jgi:hypothetical protein